MERQFTYLNVKGILLFLKYEKAWFEYWYKINIFYYFRRIFHRCYFREILYFRDFKEFYTPDTHNTMYISLNILPHKLINQAKFPIIYTIFEIAVLVNDYRILNIVLINQLRNRTILRRCFSRPDFVPCVALREFFQNNEISRIILNSIHTSKKHA